MTRSLRQALSVLRALLPAFLLTGTSIILLPALEAAAQEGHLLLTDVERIGVGVLNAPEDVAVDAEGNIFAGCADGFIYKVSPEGKISQHINTGGRPLGLYVGKDGNLLVCDPKRRAVLAITPTGLIRVVAQSAEGTPLFYADDVWAGRDGTIYFSDASTYPFGEEMRDLIRGEPLGRVIAVRPDGAVEVIKKALYFPNGVTLSPDESWLYVAETPKRRILRIGLTDAHKGHADVFVDNLPGFIDGIAADQEGNLLVAVPSVSEKSRKLVESIPGWVRRGMSGLPHALLPSPAKEGMVLKVRPDRQVEVVLSDMKGEVIPSVTNVIDAGNYLYLGFLYYGDGIGRIRKPPAEVAK